LRIHSSRSQIDWGSRAISSAGLSRDATSALIDLRISSYNRAMQILTNRSSRLLMLSLCFLACSEGDAVLSSGGASEQGADPLSRFQEILAVPDRLDRIEMLIEELRVLPAGQAGVLREALQGLHAPFRDVERVLIISGWARLDPRAASGWAFRRMRPPYQEAGIAEAIGIWAREDPDAILETYDAQRIAEASPGFLVALVEGWFASGKPSLEAFIIDLGKGETRQSAIDTFVRVKIERDGGVATRTWAKEGRGDNHYRKSVHSRVGRELARSDPDQGVEWCEEVCDTKLGRNVGHMVATEWAVRSGADAMDWLLTRPDEIETWATARAAYRQFMMNDMDGALSWMEAVEPQTRKRELLQGPVGMYVNKQSRVNPEIAIEWTEYLISTDERELTLITIARRWLRKDEAAAEAWLATSPLSEEQRKSAHRAPHPMLQ
jgi:hypothetical protein